MTLHNKEKKEFLFTITSNFSPEWDYDVFTKPWTLITLPISSSLDTLNHIYTAMGTCYGFFEAFFLPYFLCSKDWVIA